MKCCKGEQYAEVVRFYHEIPGFEIARVWGDENAPDGIMSDTGSGLIPCACGLISSQKLTGGKVDKSSLLW